MMRNYRIYFKYKNQN